jgi:hypothetical protein
VPGNESSGAGDHPPPWQRRAATRQQVANGTGGSGISGFPGHITVGHDVSSTERLKYLTHGVAELETYVIRPASSCGTFVDDVDHPVKRGQL